MKKELTNEVLEAMAKCDQKSCSECLAVDVCCSEDDITLAQRLAATALLEERAKPNVWDGAPDNATVAEVTFQRDCGELLENLSYATYTRELPKTRARQIAEKEGRGLAEKYGWNASAKELVTNVMEAALTKYARELEGKE